MCAFCDTLRGRVAEKVSQSLREQHAQLSHADEHHLVEIKLARMAERFFDFCEQEALKADGR